MIKLVSIEMTEEEIAKEMAEKEAEEKRLAEQTYNFHHNNDKIREELYGDGSDQDFYWNR